MSKKEKAKPRKQKSLDETVFKKYLKEMEEIKENSNIKFSLFQALPKSKILDSVLNLAYFYDQNFIGNKNFMHIPDVSQICQNLVKYPIILACQKNEFGEEAIVGATTIKMERNKKITDNPFFPTKDENILSITGILAKQNVYDVFGNNVRGIGKQLFKSAIKGAYETNKERKVRLICEIDCRNVKSFSALCKTVKSLQEEGLDVGVNLVGYYEIMNKNGNLEEAPTFLFEIVLEKEKIERTGKNVFSYINLSSTDLFLNLAYTIRKNTTEKKNYINLVGKNLVVYHELKPIDALEMTIEPGTTADGNDRVPKIQPVPVESMSISL